MPSVLIEVQKAYTRQEEAAIIEAIHASLIEGFATPRSDRNLCLVVHEPQGSAPRPTSEAGGVHPRDGRGLHRPLPRRQEKALPR